MTTKARHRLGSSVTSRFSQVALSASFVFACDQVDNEDGPLDETRSLIAFDAAIDSTGLAADDEVDLPIQEATVLDELHLDDGSVVRFIDETPGRTLPSIGLVLVEPSSATSRLNMMMELEMSPLEFYLWLQPDSEAPDALVREHVGRHVLRQLGEEPRRFSLGTTKGDDTWVPNCGSYGSNSALDEWEDGFNSWSNSSTGNSDATWYSTSGNVYGYFQTMDHIWGGFCVSSALPSIGFSAKIERIDPIAAPGIYQGVLGTVMGIGPGQRYLHYSAWANAPQRRLRKVGADSETSKFIMQGAWAEELPI